MLMFAAFAIYGGFLMEAIMPGKRRKIVIKENAWRVKKWNCAILIWGWIQRKAQRYCWTKSGKSLDVKLTEIAQSPRELFLIE